MQVAVENSDVWPTVQVFGAQRTESTTDQVMPAPRFQIIAQLNASEAAMSAASRLTCVSRRQGNRCSL